MFIPRIGYDTRFSHGSNLPKLITETHLLRVGYKDRLLEKI